MHVTFDFLDWVKKCWYFLSEKNQIIKTHIDLLYFLSIFIKIYFIYKKYEHLFWIYFLTIYIFRLYYLYKIYIVSYIPFWAIKFIKILDLPEFVFSYY